MSRKYYIEFVGVNGSGKTTLADKLAAYFKAQSRNVLELPHPPGNIKPARDLMHRLPKMLRYYIKHPFGFLNCAQTRWNPRYGYRGTLHTLLKRSYETGKHLGKSYDVIIQHEGSFQFYRTFGHHFADTRRIPDYHAAFQVRRFGYLPVLINLHVDLEDVLARCTSERLSVPDPSGWSLAGVSPDRLQKLMTEWIEKKDKVMERVRGQGIPVIDLSTGSSVEESYTEMLERLGSVLSSPGATPPSGLL